MWYPTGVACAILFVLSNKYCLCNIVCSIKQVLAVLHYLWYPTGITSSYRRPATTRLTASTTRLGTATARKPLNIMSGANAAVGTASSLEKGASVIYKFKLFVMVESFFVYTQILGACNGRKVRRLYKNLRNLFTRIILTII